MAATHFAALVQRYRHGRSDRQMAIAADIPMHWLQTPLKPSTSLKTMPSDVRITGLARAIGATDREVRAAFAADVTGTPMDAEIIPGDDPLTDQMLRVWSGLDVPYRVMMLGFAKSTATLQRKLDSDDEMREVG